MVIGLNANPIVYEKKERQSRQPSSSVGDEYAVDQIDELEIFDILFTCFSLFDQWFFWAWNQMLVTPIGFITMHLVALMVLG